MATFLEESENGLDSSHSCNNLSFGEKNVKIGPLDPEIIFFRNLKNIKK